MLHSPLSKAQQDTSGIMTRGWGLGLGSLRARVGDLRGMV